jgi:esterase
MAAEIFVKRSGSGSPIVLMHGLFGAGGNLGALARALQATFTVFSLDLPGHGRSHWLPKPDLPAMAEAVRRWMDEENLARVHLLGHSLGGKVAMQLALHYPARAESLIVGDIAPLAYHGQHEPVFDALEAVAAHQCNSREEATAILSQYLREDAVIQFLLASLQCDSQGSYRWRFDLAGLREAYPALLAAPHASQTYAGPVLFIKGGASDYIREQDWPTVQAYFPQASLEVMHGCGHWLHAENPQVFNAIVMRFLTPLEQRKLAVG